MANLFRLDSATWENDVVVHARLVRQGVTFWRGPTDEVYGHRNAILFDPFGHKVEFFEYLASRSADE